MTEPWMLPGLPAGLTPQHFDAAAAAWVAHDRQRVGEVELRPLLGPGGAHFHLSGQAYEETAARVTALARLAPLLRLLDERLVHPVVLVHDPSPAEDGATPVGVCAVTGYIGSAWGARAAVAKQAPDSGATNPYLLRYPVTVAVLTPDSYGVRAAVWLPTP